MSVRRSVIYELNSWAIGLIWTKKQREHETKTIHRQARRQIARTHQMSEHCQIGFICNFARQAFAIGGKKTKKKKKNFCHFPATKKSKYFCYFPATVTMFCGYRILNKQLSVGYHDKAFLLVRNLRFCLIDLTPTTPYVLTINVQWIPEVKNPSIRESLMYF